MSDSTRSWSERRSLSGGVKDPPVILRLVPLLFFSFSVCVSSRAAPAPSPQILERGRDYRVWRWTTERVLFAPNLNTAGAIEVQTPDGQRFRSHLLGLAYTDGRNQRSVLIAQAQAC